LRSHNATSTAAIADEAMPGRPMLRTACTIACHAPGTRHGVATLDDAGQGALDQVRGRRIGVRVAQAAHLTGQDLDDHGRRRVPRDGAVGLGRVGGDPVGANLYVPVPVTVAKVAVIRGAGGTPGPSPGSCGG